MKSSIYLKLMALLLIAACSKDDKERVFKVDETQSKVEWTGSAPTHFHEGTFDVSGSLTGDKNGNISGGDFVIPIASITNSDLQEPAKTQLLTHLKSIDFFNILVHPTAKFHITKVEKLKDGEATGNVKITGDFTMIGQTHSISFPATKTFNNGILFTEGSFKLNRLQWGMTSFNDPTKPEYLLPDVDITVKVYCK